MEQIFFEISIVIIVGTLCASVARLFRQPMIPAYIIAGILLGPVVFHVIKSEELMHVLSTFGIAFLLFLVGIELDIRHFLKTGQTAIVAGIIQMLVASGLGYMVVRFLGFNHITALFLSIALAFSSTIVVMKMLDERKELDTLYGQIVIGIMLTQDFIAILFLIFYEVFNGGGDQSLGMGIVIAFIKVVLLIFVVFFSSRFILKKVFTYFARTPELLFLSSICWCLIFALFALRLGFSIEVGSLLAGISLSFLPYQTDISNRVKSLRDFFLPIFFAVLGGQLIFESGTLLFAPAVILTVFVLMVSSLIVIGTLLLFGYRSRTSFQAGIAIGQVSEFSFIILSMAYSNGMIERSIVSLGVLIGLITITLSSYTIEYSDHLYQLIRPLLKRLQRKSATLQLERISKNLEHHVVLFGYHVMGYKVRHALEKFKKSIIIIDYNPDVIQNLQKERISHIYGSMSDEEILEKTSIVRADYVISTVRIPRETKALLLYIQKNHIQTCVIVTAQTIRDALEFYELGASYVIIPTSVSVDYIDRLVKGNIVLQKKKHLRELKKLAQIECTI
ncbi:MAG TPA: cation:proton antiporter [Patescibacteria group bacterium]|nr:cation:proton antiporter [Patescibacteria group bacterium]